MTYTKATNDEREELLAEAEAEVQKAASAAPARQASRILAGESDDNRLRLIVKLTAALRAVPPVETLNTVEELDALPDGTVVMGSGGVYEKIYLDGWAGNRGDMDRTGSDREEMIGLPARVLFRPDTEESGQ